MAKRKMIIEIDEQDYEELQRDSYHSFDKYMAYIAMKNGKLLDDVMWEIKNRIASARDKDKIAEYPYNRCIRIVEEVVGNEKEKED